MIGIVDVDILAFLHDEGFVGPDAPEAARAVLEAEGLTRAGKVRMAESKLETARLALTTFLVRACAGCRARGEADADGRQFVEVAQEACPYCRGSDNRRAVSELVAACRAHKLKHLLIVGGTATLHNHLQDLIRQAGGGVQLRFVDGAEAVHTRNEATAHMQWADLAVIWGSTPLPHKVSQLYTQHPLAHKVKTITVTQRGIAGLCTQVLRAIG
jgi:hypothetical protein